MGLGVNDHWQQMKGLIMETAQDICEMTTDPRRHKETWWWNEEVAEAVGEKKIKYGKWKKENTKEAWKEYMEKLMNEENEWDHKILAGVKEGPADWIKTAEVRAVLKKMKRHKALGLLGPVAELIQATGDTGTQW